MKKSDFYYDLPTELIAQHPIEPRDSSRMLILGRESGSLEHSKFSNIVEFLQPGDCLVLNDTRVIPARLYGTKEGTGAVVEFLLLFHKHNDSWEVLAGPGKKAKVGSKFSFGNGVLQGEITDIVTGGNRLIHFTYTGNFCAVLDEIGQMPLPHYITEMLADKERYQTVYARERGSAAAPTAGLHFTQALLEKIRQKGVKVGFVTLHVGLGTFRPVKEDEITDHIMHSEHYHMSSETADLINETKNKGGRVIAVGTTCCRTLESVATKNGAIVEDDDWTSIFIYPGYQFKCIDALITNFHLPESTLIMLVSAFAGYDETMNAYQEAVKQRYRFFSFGDAMFIG